MAAKRKPRTKSQKSPPITAACLFAGMGGFSRALQNANIPTLWANENNKHACNSFRHNHPEEVLLIEKDVRELSVKKHNLAPVSILTAGFPCQSFSQAGQKSGFNDERGQCFYEIPRLLKEFGDKRPGIVILENVPNLLHGGEGLWFDEIISEIQLAGYWFRRSTCRILNTAMLTGIPQNRPRLFMVALSTSLFPGNFYEFPDKEMDAQNISKFIERGSKATPEHYLPNDNRYCKEIRKAMDNGDKNGVYQLRRYYARENKSRVCPTLTANMAGGGHNIPFIQDRWGIRRLTVSECLRLQGFEGYEFPENVPEKEQYRQIGNAVTVFLAENLILQAKLCFNEIT